MMEEDNKHNKLDNNINDDAAERDEENLINSRVLNVTKQKSKLLSSSSDPRTKSSDPDEKKGFSIWPINKGMDGRKMAEEDKCDNEMEEDAVVTVIDKAEFELHTPEKKHGREGSGKERIPRKEYDDDDDDDDANSSSSENDDDDRMRKATVNTAMTMTTKQSLLPSFMSGDDVELDQRRLTRTQTKIALQFNRELLTTRYHQNQDSSLLVPLEVARMRDHNGIGIRERDIFTEFARNAQNLKLLKRICIAAGNNARFFLSQCSRTFKDVKDRQFGQMSNQNEHAGAVRAIKIAEIESPAILAIMIDQYSLNLNDLTIASICEGGNLETLKYIHEILLPQKRYFNSYAAEMAAQNGHLHVLRYLCEEHQIPLSRDCCWRACWRNELECLSYLINYQRCSYDLQECLDIAHKYCHVKIVHWLLNDRPAID